MDSQLTCFGAAQEVTGSCHLLETASARILLDCGLHQGPAAEEQRNRAPFPFDIHALDAVVLSHAHLDHAGLLPKLAREGYRGPVYCAAPSRRLLRIMLTDAAFLAQRDIEWENNRRRRAGREPIEPIYTLDDVRRILHQCQELDYGQQIRIAEGVQLRFSDAGHILGSAHVTLEINDQGSTRTLVFSGDIGSPGSILMRAPQVPERADLVVMEATYGNRDHKDMASTLEELAAVLEQAADDGGKVLIPAFAVGRTQEIIYHLLLRSQGRLRQSLVFLDSPMAIEVSELYLDNLERLDQADLQRLTRDQRLSLDEMLAFIRPTRSPEESMAINRVRGEAIIIAGSGMCSGGRIRHHLKHQLWRRETHVVIVGFQAKGTLGRRLFDGARRVHILGNEIAVRAQIHTLGGYSAHAGREDLLRWAGRIGGRPRFALVHGEPEALAALREGLRERHAIQADIPAYGDCFKV